MKINGWKLSIKYNCHTITSFVIDTDSEFDCNWKEKKSRKLRCYLNRLISYNDIELLLSRIDKIVETPQWNKNGKAV